MIITHPLLFGSLPSNKPSTCETKQSDSDDDLERESIFQNEGRPSFGLWIYPSLFNHSCCANAVRFQLKQYCFIRALRDISPGEEIFVSYFEDQTKYLEIETEHHLLTQWNFKCTCKFCLELQVKPQFLKRKKELQNFSRLLKRAEENPGRNRMYLRNLRKIYSKANVEDKLKMGHVLVVIYCKNKEFDSALQICKEFIDSILPAEESNVSENKESTASSMNNFKRYPHPFLSVSVFDFILGTHYKFSQYLGSDHSDTREVRSLADRVTNWFFETERLEGAFDELVERIHSQLSIQKENDIKVDEPDDHNEPFEHFDDEDLYFNGFEEEDQDFGFPMTCLPY